MTNYYAAVKKMKMLLEKKKQKAKQQQRQKKPRRQNMSTMSLLLEILTLVHRFKLYFRIIPCRINNVNIQPNLSNGECRGAKTAPGLVIIG